MNKNKLALAGLMLFLAMEILEGKEVQAINQESNKQDFDILTREEVFKLSETEIFARTLYGECRNCKEEEIKRIAWVIKNRKRSNNYANTYKGVCLQKYQFSPWNSLYNTESMNSNQKETRKKNLNNKAYRKMIRIANDVMTNNLEVPDNFRNVYHFSLDPQQTNPIWDDKMQIVWEGKHKFLI